MHNLKVKGEIEEIRIRIPRLLKMRLELAAYDNDRSLNHEIWHALSKAYPDREAVARYRLSP